MSNLVYLVFLLAAVIVLMESLNKCDRANIFARGASVRFRAIEVMKACGWGLIAVGAFKALLDVLITPDTPDFFQWCFIGGFAVLIIRRRIKEIRNEQLQRLV